MAQTPRTTGNEPWHGLLASLPAGCVKGRTRISPHQVIDSNKQLRVLIVGKGGVCVYLRQGPTGVGLVYSGVVEV